MNFFDGAVESVDGSPHFVNSHIQVPILPERFGANPPSGNVVAGFRPEDIVPHGHGVVPKHLVEVEAKVDITEMLGNETLLFSALGDREFISRMQQPRIIDPGSNLAFDFNVERMHLFDAENGSSMRAAN